MRVKPDPITISDTVKKIVFGLKASNKMAGYIGLFANLGVANLEI